VRFIYALPFLTSLGNNQSQSDSRPLVNISQPTLKFGKYSRVGRKKVCTLTVKHGRLNPLYDNH